MGVEVLYLVNEVDVEVPHEAYALNANPRPINATNTPVFTLLMFRRCCLFVWCCCWESFAGLEGKQWTVFRQNSN
jgi:hypothetical protein